MSTVPAERIDPAPSAIPAWRPRPLGPVAAGLALLAVTRAALWLLLPRVNEDAYIAFRYARNLAEGHGLVYNPGERVLGATSPLWTLWLALGHLLTGDPAPWARAGGVLADAVTLAVLTGMLARHASRAAAWCFAIGFAAWPLFGVLAVSGLEMSLLVALLAAVPWAIARRSRAAGPLLGLLALTRPEGLVAAALAALWARGRDRWIAAGLAAAGLGALALWFGSPVPHSVLAKATIYGTPGPWDGRHWWNWLIPVELGEWPGQIDLLALFQLRILLAPAAVVGFLAVRRTPLAVFAWPALALWAGYAVTGVAYFFWYLAVPATAVFLLAAAGLPRMLRGRAVYVALALLIAGTWTMQIARGYIPRARGEERLFGTIAAALETRARPGDTILLEPIGMIGWRNPDLHVLDEVGLVTPSVTQARRQGPGWYASLLETERPEWLAVRYAFFIEDQAFAGTGRPFQSQAQRDSTLMQYRPITTTGGNNPTLQDLVLLRRRGDQAPTP